MNGSDSSQKTAEAGAVAVVVQPSTTGSHNSSSLETTFPPSRATKPPMSPWPSNRRKTWRSVTCDAFVVLNCQSLRDQAQAGTGWKGAGCKKSFRTNSNRGFKFQETAGDSFQADEFLISRFKFRSLAFESFELAGAQLTKRRNPSFFYFLKTMCLIALLGHGSATVMCNCGNEMAIIYDYTYTYPKGSMTQHHDF